MNGTRTRAQSLSFSFRLPITVQDSIQSPSDVRRVVNEEGTESDDGGVRDAGAEIRESLKTHAAAEKRLDRHVLQVVYK